MRRILVSMSVVLLLGAGVLATAAAARQTRPDQDVLASLLAEVHGLRAAMEQLGVNGARVQLVMGRLQLNEQRITTYTRRLDDVRERRSAMEKNVRQQQAELKDTTEGLQKSGTPPSAETAEFLKYKKADLAEATATLLRLQTEEVQLTQGIAAEQDRWTEINQRLDDLDRALGIR